MDYQEILERAQALAEEALATGTLHPPEALGPDQRCGSLVVGESWIAAQGDRVRRLDYYGGFEYIDAEYRLTLGDTVFYSIDADRVLGAIETLEYKND